MRKKVILLSIFVNVYSLVFNKICGYYLFVTNPPRRICRISKYPEKTTKEKNMNYNQQLPEYSNAMYLKGFNPLQILEAMRQTNRKKQKKKKDESILEKEMFNFIQGMATVVINEALDDIFKDFK